MRFALLAALSLIALTEARADDLYHNQPWANVAADRKASQVGDVLTVVVYQNAEARNAARNDARRQRNLNGALQSGSVNETALLSLDGSYSGQGEVRRSESFVTQISVSVEAVLANGDLQVGGEQMMFINGERTTIRVRGRVRPDDITTDNQVLSTRIADAQINYDGRGFVSRNARPGLLQSIFGFLGLGG